MGVLFFEDARFINADAQLFKKSLGDKSCLFHMGHIHMENRNGLIVGVQMAHANGSGKREAALALLGRRDNRSKWATTVGADQGHDCKAFIKGCRKLGVRPHVAAKDKHSAIDGRTHQHDDYMHSLKVRKRIEEPLAISRRWEAWPRPNWFATPS